MIDKILGAVFDFDGTLIDSTDFWKTAGTEYLLSRGLKPPADIQEKIQKLSLDASYEYFRAPLKTRLVFRGSGYLDAQHLDAFVNPYSIYTYVMVDL